MFVYQCRLRGRLTNIHIARVTADSQSRVTSVHVSTQQNNKTYKDVSRHLVSLQKQISGTNLNNPRYVTNNSIGFPEIKTRYRVTHPLRGRGSSIVRARGPSKTTILRSGSRNGAMQSSDLTLVNTEARNIHRIRGHILKLRPHRRRFRVSQRRYNEIYNMFKDLNKQSRESNYKAHVSRAPVRQGTSLFPVARNRYRYRYSHHQEN